LGGILIGVVGDRIGRKCALWTSMLLMSLCWSMISSLGLKMPSAKLLEVEPLSPSKYDIYMSQVGKINSWLI
jgi:MFS family permease